MGSLEKILIQTVFSHKSIHSWSKKEKILILPFKRTFLCANKYMCSRCIYTVHKNKHLQLAAAMQTDSCYKSFTRKAHSFFFFFFFYHAKKIKNNKPSLYCHINTDDTQQVQKLHDELTVHVGFSLPTEAGWMGSF